MAVHCKAKVTLCALLVATVFFSLLNLRFHYTMDFFDVSVQKRSARSDVVIDDVTTSATVDVITHLRESTSSSPEGSFNISRDVALYVRMFHRKRSEYFDHLASSMKHFWIFHEDLIVVLDDSPQDRKLGPEIAAKFPYPKVHYEKQFDFKYYHGYGQVLSELSAFYADTFCDKKYVGLIDSDTFFTTPVTAELLFNGTKPHMNCAYGLLGSGGWPESTFFTIGKKEVLHV